MGHPVIDALRPYREESYEELDLNRLAAYTIRRLQDEQIPTTFENIVVAAYKMFPRKFSLVGFPDYPDAARVNRALLQLRPKYRNWARGNVRKGFVLTESGLREVKQVGESLSLGPKHPGGSVRRAGRRTPPRTRDLTEDIEFIQHSSLFAKWQQGLLDSATDLEFFNLIRAYAYSPSKAIRQRLETLRNTAIQLNRRDILEFLDAVGTRFEDVLRLRS